MFETKVERVPFIGKGMFRGIIINETGKVVLSWFINKHGEVQALLHALKDLATVRKPLASAIIELHDKFLSALELQ